MITRVTRLRPILAHTSLWAPGCAPKLGRQVQTCPTRRCARLASIFQLTGDSTPWVDAARTRQAAISLTRLNMTRPPMPGRQSQPFIPTTRSTTWLASCSPTVEHHTSTASAVRQQERLHLPIAYSGITQSQTPLVPFLLRGQAPWQGRLCPVGSRSITTSCTSWVDSLLVPRVRLTRSGSLLLPLIRGLKNRLCCLRRAPTYRRRPSVT